MLQDPLDQRRALAETVGSKDGASGKANFEGDASAGNPNDSPRPADRSDMGQPFADNSRVAQLNETKKNTEDPSEDSLVPFADTTNARVGSF